MKIFISGPMAGLPNDNFKEFKAMEDCLRVLGYDMYNPAWNKFGHDWERREFLALDIQALSCCDAMVQLDGWQKASGCMAEFAFASAAKIDIYPAQRFWDLLAEKTKRDMIREEDMDPYEMR